MLPLIIPPSLPAQTGIATTLVGGLALGCSIVLICRFIRKRRDVHRAREHAEVGRVLRQYLNTVGLSDLADEILGEKPHDPPGDDERRPK
jgi:hypothetical protein